MSMLSYTQKNTKHKKADDCVADQPQFTSNYIPVFIHVVVALRKTYLTIELSYMITSEGKCNYSCSEWPHLKACHRERRRGSAPCWMYSQYLRSHIT